MADRNQTKALFGDSLNPDGTLRAVSPSQIVTFVRCGLRWHFEKKAKLPKKPMGKGAAIGDKAHKHIEAFLNTGQDVRGALELVGAKMLEPYLWAAPFNKGPGIVEGPLLAPRLSTPGGVLITGYFDYYIPGVPRAKGPSEWPIIIDHKFKKDLAKWGTDEAKLKDDPQTLIYGNYALTREPEARGVVVRQHQHQTEGEGGRFPLPVEVSLTRDDLLRRWGALAATVDGPMVESAKIPPGGTPDGVPYNTEACYDFGGCDFALTCKHSPSNRFGSLLRGSLSPATKQANATPSQGSPIMGLLSQVPQTAEQTTALLQASVAAFVNIPVIQAKEGGLYILPGGSPGKFEGKLGARFMFALKNGDAKVLAETDTVRTTDEETLCMFEGRPFVKPAPPAPAPVPVATAPAPALTEEKATKARRIGIVDVSTPTGTGVAPPDAGVSTAAPVVVVTTAEALATPVTAPAPVPEVETEEKKAKRGRPTKEEQAARAAQTVPDGLILCVGCTSPKATDLAGYVKGICEAVATKYQTPDVRLGHKQSDLAFGGWKALIAMEAAKAPPKGLCSIRPSELADPIIEALIPIASAVVMP